MKIKRFKDMTAEEIEKAVNCVINQINYSKGRAIALGMQNKDKRFELIGEMNWYIQLAAGLGLDVDAYEKELKEYYHAGQSE